VPGKRNAKHSSAFWQWDFVLPLQLELDTLRSELAQRAPQEPGQCECTKVWGVCLPTGTPSDLRVCCEGKKPMELSTCSVLAWNVIIQRYQESQVCCHGSVWVCTTVRYGNSDCILLMADLLSHTNCIPPCLEKRRLCVLYNFIGELVCWDTTLSTSHCFVELHGGS